MDRRKLLTRSVQGAGLMVAGVLGGPALLSALTPVLRSSDDPEWRPVGPLGDFPVGSVQKAVVRRAIRDKAPGPVEQKSVYVWRRGEDDVVVYSRACTDLGCPVTYDPGSTWFYCPCHGGIFRQDGEPMAGPPKFPLWRYATRVRDDVLEIDLRSVPPMA